MSPADAKDPEPGDPAGKPAAFTVGPLVAEALRYWEPRRILYNMLLGAIVAGYFIAALPRSRTLVTLDGVLWMIFLAVLANVCYCAAYVVDVFVQLSPLRETWLRLRWILFVVGLVFAGIITRFFAIATFSYNG
jgi:hypothetical protein